MKPNKVICTLPSSPFQKLRYTSDFNPFKKLKQSIKDSVKSVREVNNKSSVVLDILTSVKLNIVTLLLNLFHSK